MGTLLALNWSLLSVYTNSVARAYLRPFDGLEGAGEGGRSWPSRSMCFKALPTPFTGVPLEAMVEVGGSFFTWTRDHKPLLSAWNGGRSPVEVDFSRV